MTLIIYILHVTRREIKVWETHTEFSLGARLKKIYRVRGTCRTGKVQLCMMIKQIHISLKRHSWVHNPHKPHKDQ